MTNYNTRRTIVLKGEPGLLNGHGQEWVDAGTKSGSRGHLGKLRVLRNLSESIKKRQEKRQLNNTSDKYALTRIASSILSNDWRVSYCQKRTRHGTVDIKRGKLGKAYVSGTLTCGSVWVCPVCALKKAGERQERVMNAIRGKYCVLVTYTLQHELSDRLESLMKTLKDGLRHTLNGKARKLFSKKFGLYGAVRSFEVRYSFHSGWHPHSHELLIFDEPVSEQKACEIRNWLSRRYCAYLRDHGYYTNDNTVHVSVKDAYDEQLKGYLTKSVSQMGLTAEITQGHKKGSKVSLSPFQLLAMYKRTKDSRFANLFSEYAYATKGLNWVTFSRSLTQAEKEEQESTEQESVNGDETIFTLMTQQWLRIFLNDMVREFLIFCSSDEDMGGVDWLLEKELITPEEWDEIVESMPKNVVSSLDRY